ncbi:MAG: peptide deformylase [Alphaproteobacteria bacterium]|nr:peptide deformylase [Alphaproteobacteria bacterium]
MAILKIARMGHPILRARAEEISDPSSEEVRRLVEDMVETLEDAKGAGLAAPQVHVPKRLVLFSVPQDRTTEAEDDPPQVLQVLINPVVEPIGEDREVGWEACLSVPGMIGAVPRYARIRYRGLTLDGSPVDRTVSGFHARVVQHECDHLDGILYPMRMTDMSLFGFVEEMSRLAAESEEEIEAAAE